MYVEDPGSTEFTKASYTQEIVVPEIEIAGKNDAVTATNKKNGVPKAKFGTIREPLPELFVIV